MTVASTELTQAVAGLGTTLTLLAAVALSDARSTRIPRTSVVPAGLCLASALLHALATPEHSHEAVLYGTAMAVIAILQGLLAVALWHDERPRVLWCVLAVQGAVIGLWLLTRTVGVPLGPEAGEVESIGLLDGLATAVEALTCLTAVRLLIRATARGPLQDRRVAAGP